MKTQILAFVLPILAEKFDQLIDFITEKLIVLVEEAEEEFEEGKKKKDQVVKGVLEMIDQAYDLNFFYKMLVKQAVKGLVDLLIVTLNNALGHNWIEKINEYKEILEGFQENIEEKAEEAEEAEEAEKK